MNTIKTHDIDTDHRRHNQYTPVLRKKKKKSSKRKTTRDRQETKRKGKLDIEV